MGMRATQKRSTMQLALLVTLFQLFTLVKGSDNAISFEYQHDGFRQLLLKCSLVVPSGMTVSMMDFQNETSSSSQKICWIDAGTNKPTAASTLSAKAVSVRGNVKSGNANPAYLEMQIPDYKPDSAQIFRCEVSMIKGDTGDTTVTSLKITVNQKDPLDEGDTRNNLRTAVIVLAVFCALLLLSLLLLIYWIRRRHGRFASKKTTSGYFQNMPQSYSKVQDDDNHHGPIYSVSTLDGSHNSVFKPHNSVKARSTHGSLCRTNSCRQDGRSYCRPLQPPPLPPAMVPRGRAPSLWSQISTAKSTSSKIQYAQPQDAIGQSLLPRDTGESPDSDKSLEFNSKMPIIRSTTQLEADKRLSCSL